jgi:signal transduction histidine kinase
MGSLLGGLRGGIFFSTLASTIFFLFSLEQSFQNKIDIFYEIILFYFFGVATGLLVNREKTQREKLREAENLALLGKTAAAIVHELKTPVMVIGGFSQIIQRQFPPNSTLWKRLDIILKETKWMEDMTKNILDFSKPLSLNFKKIEIKSLINEALNLSVPNKKETIQVRFITPVPEIKLDPERFKQVLVNFVNNALQAVPNKLIKINVTSAKQSLIIEIIDQGPGIPKEYQDKIFEPFFSTTVRGTGLGLALAKRIIEAHQGKIFFRTNPQKGTTFIIIIPTNL